jgi:hypothetical protein
LANWSVWISNQIDQFWSCICTAERLFFVLAFGTAVALFVMTRRNK